MGALPGERDLADELGEPVRAVQQVSRLLSKLLVKMRTIIGEPEGLRAA
jgi:hypothetical protein